MLYADLNNERKFAATLANNQCDIVEGTVQVLYEEPSGGGRGPLEHIRIGDKDFEFTCMWHTVAYNRTINNGGQLKNGVVARLHYIGEKILKVEIKQ